MNYQETHIATFPTNTLGKQDVTIEFDKKGSVYRMAMIHNAEPMNTNVKIETYQGEKLLPFTDVAMFPIPNGNGGYIEAMMPITMNSNKIVVTFDFKVATTKEETYKLFFLMNTNKDIVKNTKTINSAIQETCRS